jgi:hypothetical protein
MNGTGSALGNTAAEFGSGKSDGIAQNPQQGCVGKHINGYALSVYFQIECCHTQSIEDVNLGFWRIHRNDKSGF